jgi:DNA-binding response OmpR family regulator
VTDAERIEELEAEVEYLRGELGLTDDQTALAKIASAFPTRGMGTARLMYALYRTYPRCLSKAQLFDVMNHHSEDSQIKVVDIYICRVRKALGFDAITTHWGVGYSLSVKGYGQVLHALQGLKVAA